MNDIETEDALRLLTAPSTGEPVGPQGWTRRKFLQAVGAGAAGGMAVGTFASDLLGFDLPEAWAGTPIGATDGILVVITFYGGVDGLNVVVPITNSLYYSQRPALALAPAATLPMDATFGLHPQLTYLQQLWQSGQVAVVHGAGNPDADLSHFTSMGSWMRGRYGAGVPGTGWVGRWLDGLPAGTAEMAAMSLGTGVSLQMTGSTRRGLAVSPDGWLLGAEAQPPDLRMYEGLRAMAQPAGRGVWHDLHSAVVRSQLDLARDVAPSLSPAVTGSEMVEKMTVAARLINANLGIRVLDIGLGGFDTHDNQAGKLSGLLEQFDDGLAAFFATLSPTFRSRTSLLTLSEFGRTSFSNGSNGTDHGTSNVMMVIGSNVKGGHYGAPSSLAVKNRWDRMVPTTDFRHVLGSCLDGWLGGSAATVLGAPSTDLGLFRYGPGGSPPVPPPPVVQPPSAGCEFVALSPRRLLDTRDGTGGRLGALQGGETWRLSVAGREGVPDDAVAVVLNLTGVNASTSCFVTVWPGGGERPDTSNLNLEPGPPVANFATVRLREGGLDLFVNAGSADLVIDVTGYFRAGSSTGFVPLGPDRLLDTRDGTGGRLGALGAGEAIDLQVTGALGVPSNATAVVVNLTGVLPSLPTYLALYPAGGDRPGTSSLNLAAGAIRPNLVVCPIGAAGRITLYNHSGSVDVVADVLGAFVPGAGGCFVAVSPKRVLDTRIGLGAPGGRLGDVPLSVRLRGVGGVPDSPKVSAVILNVTAVEPTLDTFIVVFPSGAGRPTASNLNVPAGRICPNGVFARLGPDGAAQFATNAGAVDIVADVVGYITA